MKFTVAAEPGNVMAPAFFAVTANRFSPGRPASVSLPAPGSRFDDRGRRGRGEGQGVVLGAPLDGHSLHARVADRGSRRPGGSAAPRRACRSRPRRWTGRRPASRRPRRRPAVDVHPALDRVQVLHERADVEGVVPGAPERSTVRPTPVCWISYVLLTLLPWSVARSMLLWVTITSAGLVRLIVPGWIP